MAMPSGTIVTLKQQRQNDLSFSNVSLFLRYFKVSTLCHFSPLTADTWYHDSRKSYCAGCMRFSASGNVLIYVHATKRALLQIANNEDNMLWVKFHLHVSYLILHWTPRKRRRRHHFNLKSSCHVLLGYK